MTWWKVASTNKRKRRKKNAPLYIGSITIVGFVNCKSIFYYLYHKVYWSGVWRNQACVRWYKSHGQWGWRGVPAVGFLFLGVNSPSYFFNYFPRYGPYFFDDFHAWCCGVDLFAVISLFCFPVDFDYLSRSLRSGKTCSLFCKCNSGFCLCFGCPLGLAAETVFFFFSRLFVLVHLGMASLKKPFLPSFLSSPLGTLEFHRLASRAGRTTSCLVWGFL